MKATYLCPTSSSDPVPLAMLGAVSCGFPSPAADYEESELSLDQLVGIRPTSSIFLFRANGDSMTEAGIHDGDVLVVDKAKTAASGDVVIACLNNEFLVKRLIIQGDGRVLLMPENPKYKPISIGEGEILSVWGACLWVLHKL
jgi:DNA polymerase V